VLDSEKFLADKEKTSACNSLYYISSRNNPNFSTKEDDYFRKRKSLINYKYKLKRKLKKVSGREKDKRSKLVEKLKNAHFKLDSTKRIF
jgi:hypothetical protein